MSATATVTTAVRTAPELGLRAALGHVFTITGRNLIHLRRNPTLILVTAMNPIMLTLLFVYVFGGAIAGGTDAYVQFVIPGLILQTVAFGSVVTGMGLNTDVTRGIVDRFRSLPIARAAVLTGRVLADTVMVAGSVLLVTGVGVALGFDFTNGLVAAVGAYAIAIGYGFGLSCVAATVGLGVRNPETAQSAGFVWLFPLTFASSALAPATTMPGWLQAFVKVNPMTSVADALRALLLGGPAARPVLQSIAWIAALVLVFGSLAVRLYRRTS